MAANTSIYAIVRYSNLFSIIQFTLFIAAMKLIKNHNMFLTAWLRLFSLTIKSSHNVFKNILHATSLFLFYPIGHQKGL
jgi:hypothetical protein